MPRPNRKHAGTDRQSYLLEDVPRSLIARALAKCRRQAPPVSLRWQLQALLERWLIEPEAAQPEEPARRPVETSTP